MDSISTSNYASSLIFGGSESELFVSGFIRQSGKRITLFSRLTNAGTFSWHYGYDQGNSNPNYQIEDIKYLDSGTKYIFGCISYSSTPAPFGVVRASLNSVVTSPPTAN